MKVIEHDPALAREVYEVFASMTGRKKSKYMYWRWLQEYVKPIARAMRSRGVVFFDPYGGREGMTTMTVKVPRQLYRALEGLSKELGVTKATLTRFALAILLEALDELDGGDGDGDAGSGD